MKVAIFFCGLLFSLCLRAMHQQDPSNQHWDGKFFHKATRESLPLAKKMLDEFDWNRYTTIVDVGCGPGALTAHIAKRAPHAQVMGVDPSESMIKFAQGYFQKPANLCFKLSTLPVIHNYWDFIFSCNAFHLLPREKQIAALKSLASYANSNKDAVLFIIMAAKTDAPQAFTRAYAATLDMQRWQKLRSINLNDYYQPHDIASFKELVKDTGWDVKEAEIRDEHITFKNEKRLKKFISSWMGGFEFVVQLSEKEQKKLIKDLVTNYLEEEQLALDGTVEWRSARLIVYAQKPKKI